MAIKTYNKGDATKLAPNFRAREFDCPGSGCCTTTLIDEKLVQYLQKIREHFNKPIEILAYRCPVHNSRTPNASPNSKHCQGMAADFHIDGVDVKEIAKYAESIGVLGIGLYDSSADGHFVHIDTRTSKSFWLGHAQKYVATFGGAAAEKLTVDGQWGKSTTLATQKFFGTHADGIISNQSYAQKKFLSGACESSWEFKTSGYQGGSDVIRALQKLVGTSQDGIMGYNSVVALQNYLVKTGYLKDKADGFMGPKTVSAWQAYLNNQ